jgi:hypothetical protein
MDKDLDAFSLDELINEIKRRSETCLIVVNRDPDKTEQGEIFNIVDYNMGFSGAWGCIEFARRVVTNQWKHYLKERGK